MNNNDDAQDCLICFCPIEDKSYECSNPKCVTRICDECFGVYLGHAVDKNLIPKCINNKCQSYYTLSCLNGLDKEHMKKYNESCLNYFVSKDGDKVKNKLEEDLIVKRLREEKIKYIKDRFPKAIALVVENTFDAKMKKLDKQKKEKIKEDIEKSKRLCMNLFCDGHLDEELKCMICSSRFCGDCEKKISNDNHRCDKNDIDSVNHIRNMIKCPKCNLPIEKSQGCNFMTCANCDTNFDYVNGHVTSAGNHGQNTSIRTTDKYKLTNIYEGDDQEVIDLLLNIESLEPSKPTYQPFISVLTKYYKKKDNDTYDYGKKLAKELDIFTIDTEKSKKYYQIINEINILLKDNIDIDKLQQIDEMCRNL